jgi:hypothetical protein
VLIETPIESIYDVVVAELQAGMSPEDLLVANYVLGIAQLQLINDNHVRLQTLSASLWGSELASDRQLHPLLWAVYRSQEAKAYDVDIPDPPCVVELPNLESARSAVGAGLSARDWEQTEAGLFWMLRNDHTLDAWHTMAEHGAETNDRWHTAIEIAHGRRLLDATGWRAAEYVFRGMAQMACQANFDGNDQPTVPSFERNRSLVDSFPTNWANGSPDTSAVVELLTELRTADDEGAADAVLSMLNDGVSPDSLWDAITLAAAELTLRDLASPGLHGLTSHNGLHSAYILARDDRIQRMLLLRAASYVTMSRDAGLAKVGESSGSAWHIDGLEPSGTGTETPEQILEMLGGDRLEAVRVVMGYIAAGGDRSVLIQSQADMTLARARDAHQIKFPVAMVEEADRADPVWHAVLFACSVAHSPRPTDEVLDDYQPAIDALAKLAE